MTKLQTSFKLSRPLTGEDLKSIQHMHSVIGFFAVRIAPGGDELLVEYDYSRLTLNEVRGSLENNGIPIA